MSATYPTINRRRNAVTAALVLAVGSAHTHATINSLRRIITTSYAYSSGWYRATRNAYLDPNVNSSSLPFLDRRKRKSPTGTTEPYTRATQRMTGSSEYHDPV